MGRRWAICGVTLALTACEAGAQPPASEDASVEDTSIDDAATVINQSDAPGYWQPDASPPQLLPAPSFPCLDAGADASRCPLPPSRCDGDWLEYFDNGKCVEGVCQFTPKLHSCADKCVDGGCTIPQLTAPSN